MTPVIKQYSHKWVNGDGTPVFMTATFVEAEIPASGDTGQAINLPDQVGWWHLAGYGGSIPPALQSKIDKVMKAAPRTTVVTQVAAASPWDVPTEEEVSVPTPTVEDNRMIATFVLEQVRKADDPQFDTKVAELVEAQAALEAEVMGS